MKNTKLHILSGLKSLLEYHGKIGIDHYPRNDSVEKFLGASPGSQLVEEKKGQRPSPGMEKPSTAKPSPADRSTAHRVKLSEIAQEVRLCHACDLHRERLYPVPGRGSNGVRLMIVGDWLAAGVNGKLSEGLIFGAEQDEMVARMLQAIKLPPAAVYITNVIKCAVPAKCQPQAAHVRSCLSYLRREIVSSQPELICTMGMVAARALLEKSLPLSRLRGRFHPYQADKDTSIPVLATYHPTYLLQNPEMKQATWADLQLLGKRLGLSL